MLTKKKSIVSCFVAGALLCTLTPCRDLMAAAAGDTLTVASAEISLGSGLGAQDIRKTSLEENIREIVIKSTEKGSQQSVGPETAAARIAGASVAGGAADFGWAVQNDQLGQTTKQSAENTKETTGAELQNMSAAAQDNGALTAQAAEAGQEQGAQAVAPELQNKAVTTVDTYQNIRQEPSEESEIVGRLYEGSAGDILETGDGWTKISSGGVEGWVHNEYIVSGEAAQAFAEETLELVATVKEDGVRVRAGASVDSTWIGVVNGGEVYRLLPEETAEEAEETEESSETAETKETETSAAAETGESQKETAQASGAETASRSGEALEAVAETVTETVTETVSVQGAALQTEGQTDPAQSAESLEAAELQWVKIVYEDDTEGYVCADYVTTSFRLGEAKSMEQVRAEEEAKAQAEKEAAQAEKKSSQSASAESGSGWVSLGEFKITAYCGGACCNGKWAGTTASGATPSEGRTIAVAPWIIPYGTQVKIEGMDGVYVAEDTGGFANSNPYQIDLFIADHSRTGSWGVRYREVWVKR